MLNNSSHTNTTECTAGDLNVNDLFKLLLYDETTCKVVAVTISTGIYYIDINSKAKKPKLYNIPMRTPLFRINSKR